jgi:hypothetical protein
MKTLNILPKVFAGTAATVGAAVVVVGATASQSLAGSFTGTYTFDGPSQTPAIAATAATETQTGMPASVVDFGAFSAGSGLTAGSGVGTGGNPGNAYTKAGWTTSTTTPDNTDYFQFSLSAPSVGAGAANDAITKITSITFDTARNNNGPQNWALSAFLGATPGAALAYTAGNSVITGGTVGTSFSTQTINNSINAAFLTALNSAISGTTVKQITFRLYGYGATNNGGTFSVDNVRVAGDAIPTPAAVPALIAFGAGLWRKRRQMAGATEA